MATAIDTLDLQPREHDALVIVDVQNDFLPDGKLGVPRGDEVVPPLNRVGALFADRGLPVIATRDWHPAAHCSFHAQGGPWPPHCIADTMPADTQDTEAAAAHLVPLALKLQQEGIDIQAVRLDSGDLGEHARKVRAILDAAGLDRIHIFASGNLDEFALERLLSEAAPIDGFGVGTRMNTSADQPYFDCAYKLQEYAGTPRRKRSEGKATWPGRKQVYRRRDAHGRFVGDVLTTTDDVADGEALLEPVMRAGRRLGPVPLLAALREFAAAQLVALPEALRRLDPAPPYPVHVGTPLRALAAYVDRRKPVRDGDG